MNITVFSHVLNEEELLPYWLKHHRRLFTHGVILDVGCTDRSMDIIREMCPTWEIIALKPEETYHPNLDVWLIEYHESRFSGWKIALNISEFLIIDDLQEYLSRHSNILGFKCMGLVSVDREIVDNYNDLYSRYYAYTENGNIWDFNIENIHIDGDTINAKYNVIKGEGARNRLLHQNIKGEYESGRHLNRISDVLHNDIYILWIGRGSPKIFNRRCMEWVANPNKIFNNYKLRDFTLFTNLKLCIHFWENECNKSYDLSTKLPLFGKYMEYNYKLNTLQTLCDNIVSPSANDFVNNIG